MASIAITFVRGARRVTGSNFLVTVSDASSTTKILIDCGLAQGEKFGESINGEPFSYDPSAIDAVFFTHAHADHIGLYPKLVKDGFMGKAYATAPTRDLMPIMLEDSVALMVAEATRTHQEPPYRAEDIGPAVERLITAEYHKSIKVSDSVSVTYYNAGHIVGSAVILIEALGRKILFTGDLGRVPSILVPDREVPEGVEVLVTESVYGNRTHGDIGASEQRLKQAILNTAKNKGVLLIPAFSLERTQIILSVIDRMMTTGELPQISVFMDSPLAAKVTKIYTEYPEFLRPDIRERLVSGDDPFAFKTLRVTANKESSQAIDSEPGPKVIIAGAGMSHGGRIRHHELRYLGDLTTTLLLVGYQVAGSLGRRLKDGQKKVDIDGREVKVRATIDGIDGFSAHADRDDLLTFAEAVKPKRVFVVLGETEAATFLAQRISGFLDIPVDVPREGETYEI